MTRARVLAGFVTTLSATNDLNVGIITGTNGNFSGDLNVTGVLTYEDVTNVDSVGLITARSGIIVTGVTTSTSAIFGSAVTINSTGIDAGSGIISATSFVGSGEGLTGVASTDFIITGTAATFNNTVEVNDNFSVNGTTTLTGNIDIVSTDAGTAAAP